VQSSTRDVASIVEATASLGPHPQDTRYAYVQLSVQAMVGIPFGLSYTVIVQAPADAAAS
jgi:hypothetical protein